MALTGVAVYLRIGIMGSSGEIGDYLKITNDDRNRISVPNHFIGLGIKFGTERENETPDEN